jgi:hypothetical protein
MHHMQHTGGDGVRERWQCPICDRTVLVTWPRRNPDGTQAQDSPFTIDVLIVGDETVQHTGSHGPVSMTEVGITQ